MVQWTGHWLSPQRDLGGNKIALIGYPYEPRNSPLAFLNLLICIMGLRIPAHRITTGLAYKPQMFCVLQILDVSLHSLPTTQPVIALLPLIPRVQESRVQDCRRWCDIKI